MNEKMYRTYAIKHIVPLPPSAIVAVYRGGDGALTRTPVLCIAVTNDGYDEDAVELWDQIRDGAFSDCQKAVGFIGLEYGSVQLTWS